MRRFYLREYAVVAAHGVWFDNDEVILRWIVPDTPSICTFGTLVQMEKFLDTLDGTVAVIEWVDGEDADALMQALEHQRNKIEQLNAQITSAKYDVDRNTGKLLDAQAHIRRLENQLTTTNNNGLKWYQAFQRLALEHGLDPEKWRDWQGED